MFEELRNALYQQVKTTFNRVQRDYGSVGVKMAQSLTDILVDQDFVGFLFGFYDGARVHLESQSGTDEHLAYLQVMSDALFFHKWQHQLPINTPCHVEEILAGNRYLRRFLRELFRDTYES